MIDRKIYLSARSVYKKGEKVYFFNEELNTLFTYDLYNEAVEAIEAFEEYHKSSYAIFGDYIIENGDELFLMPFYSNVIGIYNTKVNKGRVICIPEFEENYGTSYFAINKAVVWKNRIWMFSSNPSIGVYILDMSTYTVWKDVDLSKKLEKYPIVSKIETVKGSSFYAGVSDKNLILMIDIEKKEVEERKVPISNGKIFMFGDNGKNIWFVLRDSTDVYEWYIEDNKVIRYSLDGNLRNKEDNQPYVKFAFWDQETYILGFGIQAIMKINRDKRSIEKAFDFPNGFNFLDGKKAIGLNAAFWATDKIEDKFFFFPSRGNKILIYDVKTGRIAGKELTIDKEKIPNYKELIMQRLFDVPAVDEMDSFFSLYDCIEYEQDKNEMEIVMKETVGSQIWKRLNDC